MSGPVCVVAVVFGDESGWLLVGGLGNAPVFRNIGRYRPACTAAKKRCGDVGCNGCYQFTDLLVECLAGRATPMYKFGDLVAFSGQRGLCAP